MSLLNFEFRSVLVNSKDAHYWGPCARPTIFGILIQRSFPLRRESKFHVFYASLARNKAARGLFAEESDTPD